MALCSCCSTKPPICSTCVRTFSRSSLKRREMWCERSAVSILSTLKPCAMAGVRAYFVYIRSTRTSTGWSTFVTSSSARGQTRIAHRGACVHSPDSLHRELAGESAALALGAAHIEPAPVPLQRMLDDRQPEPRAALPLRPARIDPVKALGQPRNVLRRNSDTRVDHRKVSTIHIAPPPHADRTLRRRVLQAVHQEIGEGGFDFVRRAEQTVRGLELQEHTLRTSAACQGVPMQPLEHARYIDRFAGSFPVRRFQARELEQIRDDGVHALSLRPHVADRPRPALIDG